MDGANFNNLKFNNRIIHLYSFKCTYFINTYTFSELFFPKSTLDKENMSKKSPGFPGLRITKCLHLQRNNNPINPERNAQKTRYSCHRRLCTHRRNCSTGPGARHNRYRTQTNSTSSRCFQCR